MNVLLFYRLTLLANSLQAATATPTPKPAATAVLISKDALQMQSNLILLGAGLLLLIIWIGVLLNSNLFRSRKPPKTPKEN